MKFFNYQKQDLPRAALHDGLILGWDTGLGKTWAMFTWPLLKCGFTRLHEDADPYRLKPNAPVLIVAPGDLHPPIIREALEKFHIEVIPLASQADFQRLCRREPIGADGQTGSVRYDPLDPIAGLPQVTDDGRPSVPPGFYITSYTQLTTNGVQHPPDADDWDNPDALLRFLCLNTGDHVALAPESKRWFDRPTSPEGSGFASLCHFFAWRYQRWWDAYSRLGIHPNDDLKALDKARLRELEALESAKDPKFVARETERIEAAYKILNHLVLDRPVVDLKFEDLAPFQRTFVTRAYCAFHIEHCSAAIGTSKAYRLDTGKPYEPQEWDGSADAIEIPATRKIRCIYSPSLADLCYEAFECVVVDEGVHMKGEDTFVGLGIRLMNPKYRLVLSATPIKNRGPDIFRLAWWATGGKPDAHARFPYADASAERDKFAKEFMVSECNVSKAATASSNGSTPAAARSRYTKLTAEFCNIHRLWKLLGPIVLRRRKQDTGEDIVPRVRRVVRCEMGTLQNLVYKYHLNATYTDRNGDPAIGAQLQALRMAAADPASEHLQPQPGGATERCSCLSTLESRPKPNCPRCHGEGEWQLPHRSGQDYTPKIASVLSIIQECLARKEQVLVGSAFHDPLDVLSAYLNQASVRHVTLDGRLSQAKRAALAARFKLGPGHPDAPPVMLAGVDSMAEGHSFHLANNVILMAYSWAYDKFKQFLDRVHRITSPKPVNVYVVLCSGSIDRKLESLVDDKGSASDLALDGRLIGERVEDVNLAELLRIAQHEYDPEHATVDESLLHASWPAVRDQLAAAAGVWGPAPTLALPLNPANYHASAREDLTPKRLPMPNPDRARPTRHDPLADVPFDPNRVSIPPLPDVTFPVPVKKDHPVQTSPPGPAAIPEWKARLRDRAARLAARSKADLWSRL